MNNTKFDLTGKNALITGGAGLLGMQHAFALIKSNANLIITDLDKDKLEVFHEKLQIEYPLTNSSIYIMDVSSEDSILSVFKKLQKQNISIDILINNAALDPKFEKEINFRNESRLENFPIEEWNKQINVGLTGAFLCSKVFGSNMAERKKGGCILNIASDLSVIAPDQRLYKKDGLEDYLQPVKPVTYSVLKSGLIGLTKYLATYWLGSKIRCNSLSPGGVYTNQDSIFINRISNLIPLGRMAEKDEYQSAIQFLCSDASSYMNGHNLVMDGGRSIW